MGKRFFCAGPAALASVRASGGPCSAAAPAASLPPPGQAMLLQFDYAVRERSRRCAHSSLRFRLRRYCYRLIVQPLPSPLQARRLVPIARPERADAPPLQKKAATCRKDGAGKGLREQDLRDHVAVCVQEARLACLKQAIEQKIRGRDRVSFIDKCLSGG